MKRLVYSYLSNVNIENTNWEDLIIELVSVFGLPKAHAKYITKSYLKFFYDKKVVYEFIRENNRISYVDTKSLRQMIAEMVNVTARHEVRTIASELVSIQPLPLPNIRLHYLDYVYGKPKLTFKEKIIARIKKLFYLCKKYWYGKKI